MTPEHGSIFGVTRSRAVPYNHHDETDPAGRRSCAGGRHCGGRCGQRVDRSPPELEGGQRVVFRAGVLSVGRTVVCTSHGVRVVARVPHRGKGVVTIGDGMKGSATLRLTTRADCSVVAICQ